MSLDRRGERLPRTAFRTEHSATVFQHLNPLEKSAPAKHSLWHVTRAWDSPLTDISLLQVAGGEATTNDPTGYFPWRLLPPPIGAKVYLIGFPGFSLRDFADDEEFGIQMELTFVPATVTEVYPVRRGTGLLNYPCFEVDRAVEPGFSGGAVIFEETLCGLVSVSSSFEEKTWCATLWPLAFLEFDSELPDVMTQMSDLFTVKAIPTVDWAETRNRISQEYDDHGTRYASIVDTP